MPDPAAALSTRELLRQLDVSRYRQDPLRFAREVFPHRFTIPTEATWHRPTVRWLCGVDAPEERGALKVLGAPRAHAKSELASFLLPMWRLLTNRTHFALLISNTHAQAKKFLQSLRTEWETNRALQSLLPMVRPNKDKWSDEEVEFRRDGVLQHKFLALGSGHQLRGLRFLQYRPDLIVIDDGEDDEMVRSDLRRASYQEWVDNVVLKTDPACEVIVVGTVLHELALLNRMLRQHDEADQSRYRLAQRRCFTALDADGQSTWPERESTADLRLQRDINPYAFAQEKQNEPVDPSYCPFKSEFFTERRWWTQLPRELAISITIDPAWTARDHSKETALVCAGWDGAHRLWVLDEHHAKYDDPSLILDLILDWYLRWTKNESVHPGHKFVCVGFDTISAQKMLLTSFKQRCDQRGLHPYLRELKADRDKLRRIWQLEHLFRQERIFLRPDMTYLQRQLQGFPRNVEGGLVDVADALAYHLQLDQFRPADAPDEDAPVREAPMSFEDYARLHETTKGPLQRFPELVGRYDPRVLATWLEGRN